MRVFAKICDVIGDEPHKRLPGGPATIVTGKFKEIKLKLVREIQR